jgi:hypothetical protein
MNCNVKLNGEKIKIVEFKICVILLLLSVIRPEWLCGPPSFLFIGRQGLSAGGKLSV